MFTERTSLGLDVHARSVQACAIDMATGEIIRRGLPAEATVICGFVNELAAAHGPVLASYEAGPTGYELARGLGEAGHHVQVAAPSKLLKAPGDKVKTDRNDAMLLARLARNDDITAVRIPTREREAARDLVRARDDAERFGALSQIVYDDYLDSVAHAEARKKRLDTRIGELAACSAWTDVTRRLACLRGISTPTAFGLAVEIGDWDRFTGASIGAYPGLVPSEHSSGASRSQGGITRTGNQHARRLLVEAAWHHKPVYRPGKTLRDRWELAPALVAERADAGNRRLHRRWMNLEAHKKRHTVATTAIAWELAGWCWSLATMDT